MKFAQSILLLIFMLTLNISHAKEFNGSVNLANMEFDDVQVNGSAKFKSSKFKSLIVNGSLNFKELIVSEMVEVNGEANGKNIECQNLIISGFLAGSNIKVTKETIVNGSLNVHDSSFEEVKVNSEKIILNNSTTKNLTFDLQKNNVKQKLILKGKTIVNGDIIFNSSFGEVLISNKATIVGKVVGGKVVKLID